MVIVEEENNQKSQPITKTEFESGGLEESAKRAIDALSSTDEEIVMMTTEIRGIPEARKKATFKEVCVDYDYAWGVSFNRNDDIYRRANGRKAEQVLGEIGKAAYVSAQEQNNGVVNRMRDLFSGRR